MILRFIVKNLFSFDQETEFNLFPNKTTRLSHHKVNLDGIDVLRLSALYGANGSGKSNLIKCIELLQLMVLNGSVDDSIESKKFKLSPKNKLLPIEIGIEFYCKPHNYFYALSVNNNQIIYEYFSESKKDEDILIFERTIKDNIQKIKFFKEYYENDKNQLFASVLEEKILEKDQLLFTFLSEKYQNEFIDIKNGVEWFRDSLTIISPRTKIVALAHIFDTEKETGLFANTIINSFNTGISKIFIEKKQIDEFFTNEDRKELDEYISDLKKDDAPPGTTLTNKHTEEKIDLVKENDKIIVKRLCTEHSDENGNRVQFNLPEESDGTRRLLEYIPVLKDLISTDKVYLIDEIERSIHALTIKELVSKFSLDEQARGQLIFTTHESNLLDQDILRTDEIWFAQKNLNGATKLYSLSDYKVHNTIDIQNGYLSGRYGGIPFLSNLRDINWHKYQDAQ